MAETQENDDVRPLETRLDTMTAIDEALAWHDGDARAAIATLIADCAYLRWQLDIATRATGVGFTRGWRPQGERPDIL
ncbi:hypothetical protein [Shinella sumterensis]|uniref:hypothetical protein n=1 Tax=Shinella sumterensis TaxID=1967501 RepID=UPI00106DFE5A|nr:hypothetical protein [Shinella sumterensis]MCD1267220.1 hypothetical protein [Shinella sumterensis]